jgi:flagellin
MAQVINTNAMSLNAQRNLNTSSSSLATSIQRLSSGMRINSAKDDAAGLAISERFTTQIRGLDVATRNANDGISLAQTAEGAMVEISNNLQRVRELAVQSANATNSESDRKALQSEVDQLVGEIDRVARQTNFNGTSLLDGTFSGQLFQVGADAGQTIGINAILDANTSKMGSIKFEKVTTAAATGNATTADITVDDAKITGVDGKTVDLDKYTLKAGASAEEAAKALTNAINGKMDQTGVYAKANTDGTIELNAIKNSYNDKGEFKAIALAGTKSSVAALAGKAEADAGFTSATVSTLKVSTVADAQQAMSIADKALGAVNSARAEMGAIQNRFSSTIANLSSTSENLSASRSRIRDTDYAKETAELTRTQILQQAGTAMLSQANSSTQSVLSLLG